MESEQPEVSTDQAVNSDPVRIMATQKENEI